MQSSVLPSGQHYSQAAPGSTCLTPISTESSPRELRGSARIESQVAESPLHSDPHNHVGCPEGNLFSSLVFWLIYLLKWRVLWPKFRRPSWLRGGVRRSGLCLSCEHTLGRQLPQARRDRVGMLILELQCLEVSQHPSLGQCLIALSCYGSTVYPGLRTEHCLSRVTETHEHWHSSKTRSWVKVSMPSSLWDVIQEAVLRMWEMRQ